MGAQNHDHGRKTWKVENQFVANTNFHPTPSDFGVPAANQSLGGVIQRLDVISATASDHTQTCLPQGSGSELGLTYVDAFAQHILSALRRRSNRLAESWRRAMKRGQGCLWHPWRDAYLHLHAEMVRRVSDEGAVERGRVVRITSDRNGDKADLADIAAGGVEIDPTCAWQVDLRPGMGRSAS